MPIYFTSNDHGLPLFIQSVGNRWHQESIERQQGFPHYHWLQTERGSGTITIGGNKLPMERGAGILIAPYIAHAYRSTGGNWRTSFVSFYGSLRHHISSIAGDAPYLLVKDAEAFSFQSWTDEMVKRFQSESYVPEEVSVACYRFLMQIGMAHEKRLPQSDPAYQKYVAPALYEIGLSYGQEISVESLAKLAYITPQYLSRLFRQRLNTSVYEYLITYRMKRARELLLNQPLLSVKDVGILVGMPTISHFISVFKKRVGHTPLEFRKLHCSAVPAAQNMIP